MEDIKLLTLVLACLGVYIAYQQYQVNLRKFNLDLFEKRYAIFDALKKVMYQVTREAAIENIHINEYKTNISDARFLFNSDVTDYLQEVLNKSAELHMHQARLRTAEGTAKTDIIDQEHQVILWFAEEINNFQSPFFPYMAMRDKHFNKALQYITALRASIGQLKTRLRR
jgi:hypothetical protein